jgi:hypothetical protein
MIDSKKLFLGGMNTDDSPLLIDNDAYLNLINGRIAISEDGRNLRIENTKGTDLLTNGLLPSGDNFCIGSVYDYFRNRIIFFNWNSNNEHGIYAFDLTLKQTYIVLLSSNLIPIPSFGRGFVLYKEYRIDRNARFIDDLLYWTDGFNPPMKINVEAGIKTNQPSYVTNVLPYQTPINFIDTLTLIKRPPIYPATATKFTDTSYPNNFIQNEAFLITYRYRYKDGEVSALAMFSKLIPYNTYMNEGWVYFGLKNIQLDNAFTVVIPLSEKIPDNVEIIEVFARYGNNGKAFLIKEYSKKIASDLVLINNHNSGVGNLSFNFYNDTRGYALSPDELSNDFDGVPLKVASIEIARQRLHAANVLMGYTAPYITSLTIANDTLSVPNSTIALRYRGGSKYKAVVTFYDEYKRKAGVSRVTPILKMPLPNFSGSAPNASKITATLSNLNAVNEIPDWAFYYSIDVSDDLDCIRFVSGNDSLFLYATKLNNGTYAYTTTYSSISTFALALNLSRINQYGMGYTYNEGDIVMVKFKTPLPVSGSSIVYLRVLAVDGFNLLIEPVNVGDRTTQECVFTILTPRPDDYNDIFYNKGEIYAISNPTTNSRIYSDLSIDILPDTYVYNYSSSGYYIEFMSANFNNWDSWVKNNGFINIVDNIGQQLLDTTDIFSDTIIIGSKINGLNKFQPTNRVNTGTSPIRKLQLTNKKQEDGNVLLIISESNTASAYLGEVQLVAASSNNSVATAQNIIGTINALRNNFGTIDPSTVFEYMGNVYWLDRTNGVFAQYSPNGLFPISDFKVNRFFKKYAKDYTNTSKSVINSINGFSHIHACIDPFHREVMVTTPALIYENYATNLPSYTSVPSYATSIINRFDLADKLGKTLAFDYEENKWRSNYEFMPEWMEYANNELFGFKNGNLYSFNTNSSNYNTWFGVQYPIRLCANWNIKEMPSIIKDVFDIALESNVKPDFTVLMSTYPNVQITDLTADDYNDTEGVFYARFYLDRLSPNTTGTPEEKLYKGDVIKAQAPQIMLEFQQYNSLVYINFVSIGFAVSRGQLKIIQK